MASTLEPDQERITMDDVYNRPSIVAAPVEAVIARHIIRRVGWVAPPLIAIAWLWRGPGGAAAAAVGVAIVVFNFFAAGAVLSRAATVSLKVYHVATLLGFILRLGLITLSMFFIASVVEIDRPAMGVAAIAAYLILLTLEAGALMSGEREELVWSR